MLRRAIGKWLNAGVLEDGCVTHPDAGTPQGGVISPLLANVYLHEVLDVWFEQAGEAAAARAGVPRPLRGRLRDRLRVGGRRAAGAGRAAEAIRRSTASRCTRRRRGWCSFSRPRRRTDGKRARGPGRFDLLGFTHYWGRSRRGDVDGQAADGAAAVFTRALEADRRVVSDEPARPDRRAATQPRAASCAGTTGTTASPGTSRRSGALRVRGRSASGASGSPAARSGADDLGALLRAAAALPAAAAARRAQRVRAANP